MSGLEVALYSSGLYMLFAVCFHEDDHEGPFDQLETTYSGVPGIYTRYSLFAFVVQNEAQLE